LEVETRQFNCLSTLFQEGLSTSLCEN